MHKNQLAGNHRNITLTAGTFLFLSFFFPVFFPKRKHCEISACSILRYFSIAAVWLNNFRCYENTGIEFSYNFTVSFCSIKQKISLFVDVEIILKKKYQLVRCPDCNFSFVAICLDEFHHCQIHGFLVSLH